MKKTQRCHVVYLLPLQPHSSKNFPVQILICVWSQGFESGHILSGNTFECNQRMLSSDGEYILSKLTVGLEITLEVLLHHYTLTYQIGIWYYVDNVMVDTWLWVGGLVTFQDTQGDQLCWFYQQLNRLCLL